MNFEKIFEKFVKHVLKYITGIILVSVSTFSIINDQGGLRYSERALCIGQANLPPGHKHRIFF